MRDHDDFGCGLDRFQAGQKAVFHGVTYHGYSRAALQDLALKRVTIQIRRKDLYVRVFTQNIYEATSQQGVQKSSYKGQRLPALIRRHLLPTAA